MKSPLINGKLPNGKWHWTGWRPNEWILVIGDWSIYDNGCVDTNSGWGDDNGKTRWTKIESIVEVYYKKL